MQHSSSLTPVLRRLFLPIFDPHPNPIILPNHDILLAPDTSAQHCRPRHPTGSASRAADPTPQLWLKWFFPLITCLFLRMGYFVESGWQKSMRQYRNYSCPYRIISPSTMNSWPKLSLFFVHKCASRLEPLLLRSTIFKPLKSQERVRWTILCLKLTQLFHEISHWYTGDRIKWNVLLLQMLNKVRCRMYPVDRRLHANFEVEALQFYLVLKLRDCDW